MKQFLCLDVEADGPIPHKYSMVSFGAVIVEEGLKRTFYAQTRPISKEWLPEALAISGFSREEHEGFDDPKEVMERFDAWIKENVKGQPIFISDNNGFDFSWINFYAHTYLGRNPFGWSSRRIGDIWCGYKNDMFAKWKHMRITKHSHWALDDAIANAEALLEMKRLGLNIKF